MWSAGKSSAAYPTRESFVADCVPILCREVELLREEGVAVVQIDDPHLCLFVDPEGHANYDDADFSVDMVNEVVEGFGDIKTAIHLCRRAGACARGEATHAGGYTPVLGQLNRLKVNHLTMEFTTPTAGDMAVFKHLREDLEIGLGCVGCDPGQVDSADEIVARVETALRDRAPARITLNPDCGFAPGSTAKISFDEVATKLKNEVEASRRLCENIPNKVAWPSGGLTPVRRGVVIPASDRLAVKHGANIPKSPARQAHFKVAIHAAHFPLTQAGRDYK